MREEQDKDQRYVIDELFVELDYRTPEQIADLVERIPVMGFIVKLWRNRQENDKPDKGYPS